MSLADLVGLDNGKTAKSQASAPTPKYRDPDTGATWSGRGYPAKWLTDHEAKGRKREEFAISGRVSVLAYRECHQTAVVSRSRERHRRLSAGVPVFLE